MLTQEALHNAFKTFTQSKVLVIGDVMIDAYYWGDTNRISPEAPVPIVDIDNMESRLGGAANVALNLKSLGAEPIICSVIGEDEKADVLLSLLEKRAFSQEGIVRSDHRRTTVKTRIISDGQHLLRVDEEDKHLLNPTEENELIERINALLTEMGPKAIIFEDYDKGVITSTLINKVVTLAKKHGIPTTVDPKKRQFLDYKEVTLFKPNLKELKEGLKIDINAENQEQLRAAEAMLKSTLQNELSLITLSEHGVMISEEGQQHFFPAHPRKILDVSGAGDTVIATATLCLISGLSAANVAQISNLAGGLVCEEVGVVPIDSNRLLKEANNLCSDHVD